MKSTAKIKQCVVEITKNTTDKKYRYQTCQFSKKNRGGQRYCTLTTNKSCMKCAFYDPTTQAVLETLAAEVERTLTAKRVFNNRTKQLRGMIRKVKNIEDDVKRMEEETRREFERVHIAEYDMVQLWQDSVNTYE